MTDLLASALSHQQILLENPLAIVTHTCVALRASNGKAQSILSLYRIRGVGVETLSHPGLLVLSAAAFLIAAAAHVSRDGGLTQIPIALVGILLLAGYLGSRRAAVRFTSADGTVQSPYGTLSEAAAVASTVRAAIARINEDFSPESESVAS